MRRSHLAGAAFAVLVLATAAYTRFAPSAWPAGQLLNERLLSWRKDEPGDRNNNLPWDAMPEGAGPLIHKGG